MTDKRKGPIVEMTSLAKYMSPMGTTPAWLKREFMFCKKKVVGHDS
jgi:hypothetical protein